jgi:predicted HAD superfamily Cof-like phosphohydrolase
MENTVLDEIMMWNEERDNLDYSCVREGCMLQEEVEELGQAYRQGDIVGEADAYADIIVVATGALFKLCGGDREKFYDIMLAVTAANNTKSSTKNEYGKITKPNNFVGPEPMIKRVLEDI